MSNNKSVGSYTSADSLLKLHDLTEADLALIRKFGDLMLPKLHEYVGHFDAWLENQPD